ncbi:MAG: hypothetical protein DRO73_03105 [Candidatus Thorarchaeota archaeon]|nr:MAG: hypothetical protein DRO73_03105 [Candidatus Thorarchaeota archaeon]
MRHRGALGSLGHSLQDRTEEFRSLRVHSLL